MTDMRKTKIVCTMGPSCGTTAILKEMIEAGMNVARLNMAHGDNDYHQERIRLVREAAAEAGAIVPILMDIKGPEIRLGTLEEGRHELTAGSPIILTTERIEGNSARVSVTYADLPSSVAPGNRILIDDGLLELRVDRAEGTEVYCTAMNDGVLKPRKGVNLPGVRTTLPGVTERDVMHIRFGIEAGVDIIAVSFVRRAEDIHHVRALLNEHGGGHITIVSKIENEEGVEALDAIIEASDGIMVARGDLGVQIPAEEVPLIQREMIRKCNAAGKPVIVATQMLDSMQTNPRPTRAEVSDVANAVWQGTDAVMLSGETAAGRYPIESVRMMASIAERAEASERERAAAGKPEEGEASGAEAALAWKPSVTEVVCRSATEASRELEAAAIVTPTEGGFTPRMVAKYRPEAPIVAVSPHDAVLKPLCLLRGVLPVRGEIGRPAGELLQRLLDEHEAAAWRRPGHYVVVSTGKPYGEETASSHMSVHLRE